MSTSKRKTELFSWALPAISQEQILEWFKKITESTIGQSPSVYDKSMDAIYNKTNVGGGNHRLFDENHDLLGAWRAVREAKPDDTFVQEVMGFCESTWRELITKKGLPFSTLDKASYEEWADKIQGLTGISKDWLYDLTSFDSGEVIGTTISAIAGIFFLKKSDKEKLAELLGAMGITSIMSANPLLGILAITLTGYSFFVKKQKIDTTALAKGSALALVSSLIFIVLGFPFLLELVLAIVVTKLLRKHVLDNPEVFDRLKQKALKSVSEIKFKEVVNNISKNVMNVGLVKYFKKKEST